MLSGGILGPAAFALVACIFRDAETVLKQASRTLRADRDPKEPEVIDLHHAIGR